MFCHAGPSSLVVFAGCFISPYWFKDPNLIFGQDVAKSKDPRRVREPWKIRLHRAWPSSILHQNFSGLQTNNILFPLSWAGIQMKIGSLRTDSKNNLRQMRPPVWLRQAQTVFASHGLKGFVCAFTECWVKKIFTSRIFIGKWPVNSSVAAGKNVTETHGSLKSDLSPITNARNPKRKQSTLCFVLEWLGSREIFLKN